MYIHFEFIIYLFVVGATNASLNDTHFKAIQGDISVQDRNEYDSSRIAKVYPLKTINSVLKKLIDHKNPKRTTTKLPATSTTTVSPITDGSKIECKGASDLIILFDNTMTLKSKEYSRLLDFVATVASSWRSNLKCHVALFPQSDDGTAAAIKHTPFANTENKDEYEIKSEVYKHHKATTDKDLVNALKNLNADIKKHSMDHEMAPVNVLLVTANFMDKEVVPEALTEITKLTTTSNVNTLAIGVTGMIKTASLLTFANEMDQNLKLIKSFNDLKYCYGFLQKHLK